jgi:hypothetical protein
MKTAACGVLALSLVAACSLAPWSDDDRGEPDRHRADAALEDGQGGQDGSPLGDAARDGGPCELRSEYGTEDIESFGIIQCTDRGNEYLDIGAVFLDTCGTRVLWHAMYFSGSSDVIPGTYEVEFRGYPRIGGRYGQRYVEPILCFAGTGGTAVLSELEDYERAAGSFEDVTVAEASCDDPFEPPADPTPLFRVSFSFDGWPEPKCPGE